MRLRFPTNVYSSRSVTPPPDRLANEFPTQFRIMPKHVRHFQSHTGCFNVRIWAFVHTYKYVDVPLTPMAPNPIWAPSLRALRILA